MARYLIIIAMMIIATTIAAGIAPVRDIPDSESEIDQISGRRDLQSKLIEYYAIASALESQALAEGEMPAGSVPDMPEPLPRRSSELKDLLKKYYNLAVSLHTQIRAMPPEAFRIDSLKSAIRSNQYTIQRLERDKFDMESRCFEEQLLLIDSMRTEYIDRMSAIEQLYSRHYSNSIPILSVAGLGRQLFLNHGGLEREFSYGGRIELSAYPIIHIGDFMDFWIEYFKPRLSTNLRPGARSDVEMHWNTNLYSAGFNFKAPKIDLNYLNIILKLGAGYYWGTSTLYNVPAGEATWRGALIRTEVDFVRYKWFFPVDVYLAYQVYYPEEDLSFSLYEESGVYWGKSTFTSLSLGLRLTLWWEPGY
ncbi:MAG: hypothetical protein ACLFQX_02735 [Candidatus Kapaibacterium sp.]